jgi:hypothetical protein
VAALSDPLRARSVTRDLSAAGYNAYIISPDDADPDAPYCVRVGGYPSKEAASDAAAWAASAREALGHRRALGSDLDFLLGRSAEKRTGRENRDLTP